MIKCKVWLYGDRIQTTHIEGVSFTEILGKLQEVAPPPNIYKIILQDVDSLPKGQQHD